MTATADGFSQVDPNWSASTDDVGVTGYPVERCQGQACTDFADVAAPTATSYSDNGLSASTTYRYGCELSGAWTHVALTHHGAALRLYINGNQVAAKATTGAIETTNNPLWIGGNQPYGEYFNGLIDDLRVYTARSPRPTWMHRWIGRVCPTFSF